MTLQADIDVVVNNFIEQAPPQTIETLSQFVQKLCASDLSGQALKIGDTAPDFTLSNAQGKLVKLYDLLNTGPVILNFYRGGWCPFCSLELNAYQKLLPEIKAAGAHLVGVSPETPDESLSTAEKFNLEFEVLSDLGNDVSAQYGLVFSLESAIQEIYTSFGFDLPRINGDDSWTLPVPATYVIATDATIVWGIANPNYLLRPEPRSALNAIKQINTIEC